MASTGRRARLAWRCSRPCLSAFWTILLSEISPAAVARELFDDGRNVGRAGCLERLNQRRAADSSVTLDPAPGASRINAAAPRPLKACTRPARLIIFRCGSVHAAFLVSSRMFAHSSADGRCRFSGLAFQSAERSPSRSSARPRRVSRCLRVSQSRSEGTR